MKVALKLPRSKITWMIIVLILIVLGYLVYKRAFVYKEGKQDNTPCKVNSCNSPVGKKNCNKAIESGYKCIRSKETKNKCKKSSDPYIGNKATSLGKCKLA